MTKRESIFVTFYHQRGMIKGKNDFSRDQSESGRSRSGEGKSRGMREGKAGCQSADTVDSPLCLGLGGI